MIIKKNKRFKVWKEKYRDLDRLIQAWVFDASEVEGDDPDFTPDWLYDILDKIEESSGGYHGELIPLLYFLFSQPYI